jgi:hypothetical protein
VHNYPKYLVLVISIRAEIELCCDLSVESRPAPDQSR